MKAWIGRHARVSLARSIAAAVLALAATAASAQSWPNQTIRIVVPQPPGGLVDTAARLIQPHLEKALQQTVIVDNRPGAAGIVGTDAVAKAAADGYTLLVVAGSLTVLPATNPKVPYDTLNDLAAVALILKYPFLFLVNSQVPAKTLPEFIALAKQNPGQFNYSTTGPAGLNHLATERLMGLSGIKLQHVPYRGGAQATLALVKGEVQLLAISAQVALPHIQAGTVRAIAIGGLERDKKFPDIATVAEAGFPGYEAVSWIGMLAPKGTPKPIIDRLNTEVNAALRDPDTIAKFEKQGVSVAGGSAAAFQTMIATEVRNWTEVARAANITAQ
jgi:tripartite-type tricarboxylate transporter receptor subunit TctC